jgi:hypothetical protein
MQFRLETTECGPEVQAFIVDFIACMFKRSSDWKVDEIKAAARELVRAASAIRIAVYRDLATRKAKEEHHEEQDRAPQLQD